jgi:branched-chain amino acid transport system permease protein
VLVLAVCALVLPFFLWDFRTYQLAFAATNAIAILGLNLIAGQAGLISLGHGAFYGLGAYTLAVLIRHWGVSAYAAIPAAALVGLVTGTSSDVSSRGSSVFTSPSRHSPWPWRCPRCSRAAM